MVTVKTCPIRSAANSSPETFIANAMYDSGMLNVYGKLYTGDPNAPTSWPVAAFYTSNKGQVSNCYKIHQVVIIYKLLNLINQGQS